MAKKFSYQRLGDIFFLLISLFILPILIWASTVGMVLLITTYIFCALGTLCALLDGWLRKSLPWSRLGVAVLFLLVFAVLHPVIAAAQ